MLQACTLDQVWLVVTPQNPFKKDHQPSAEQHRLAMARLAVQGQTAFVASGFELDLPKPNYTADTWPSCGTVGPSHRFDLIIGSDNLAAFHKWKDPKDILDIIGCWSIRVEGFKQHLAQSIHQGPSLIAHCCGCPIARCISYRDQGAHPRLASGGRPAFPVSYAYIREHGLYKACGWVRSAISAARITCSRSWRTASSTCASFITCISHRAR